MKLKVISVLIVVLLVMSVPVYADTIIPNPPADALQYWVIYDDGVRMRLLTSNSPITVSVSGDVLKATEGYKRYYYEENQWIFSASSDGGSTAQSMETIYSSNHDITYEDGSGVFFFKALLHRAMKKMDFWTILRNFSAGLIPLVGMIVLLIAFGKAWAFLRNQLQS